MDKLYQDAIGTYLIERTLKYDILGVTKHIMYMDERLTLLACVEGFLTEAQDKTAPFEVPFFSSDRHTTAQDIQNFRRSV